MHYNVVLGRCGCKMCRKESLTVEAMLREVPSYTVRQGEATHCTGGDQIRYSGTEVVDRR